MQEKPKDYLTVDEVIEIINQDTRTNPTIDIAWMAKRISYIESGKTFTIPLMTIGEILLPMGRPSGKQGAVRDAVRWTVPQSNLEVELLKKAIREHFVESSGRAFKEPAATKSYTSVVGEDAAGAKPRPNPKPIAKEGESMGSGAQTIKESQ